MNKVVLITGISSGLGKSIASHLAKSGLIVYGTSRSVLENKDGINLLQMDVTDTLSVKNGIKTIIEKEGKIDVVINNAGMGYGGPIEEYCDEETKIEMDTNFYGTCRICKEVIPYMRARKTGLIINISSIMGLLALPFQGFYTASKFAIEGFSETLRYELKPFNIKVVLVNPGDFRTNFTANRKCVKNVTINSPYYAAYSKAMALIEKDENKGLNPDVLAKKIQSIVRKKNPATRYIVSSFEQKLAVWLKYILPEKLFFKIIGGHYGV